MSFRDAVSLYSSDTVSEEELVENAEVAVVPEKLFVTEDKHPILVVDNDNIVHFNIPDKSPAVIRKRIWELADYLFSLPDDVTQKEAIKDTNHYFIEGVYTRTLFMKKGTIVVGKVHLRECTNIVAMGDCTILTETGCERVKSGFVGISPKGSQKVVYVHEDTLFVNVFRTDKTTIEEVEEELLSCDRNDLREI